MDTASSTFIGLHTLMMECLVGDRTARPTITGVIDRLHTLREASRFAAAELAPTSH